MLGALLLLHISILLIAGGNVPEGGSCSSNNDRLDPDTLKFVSDCTDQTFCSSAINGTCIWRQCRRDEFPFAFSPDVPLPPMCPYGSFCPDQGSGCEPWANYGQPCQLNRDEQCAPPLDWKDLGSQQNFNGSICLHSTCMYANVTLGLPCIIDNTTYTDFGPNGQQFSTVFTRDNCCTPHLYCDESTTTCQPTRAIGSACQADQQCESYNCGTQGVCEEPPETPLKVVPWQYAVTSICIISAVVATCVLLTLVHKRHRFGHCREVEDYYYEQISLRRSIIALHFAAADRESDMQNLNCDYSVCSSR